MPTILAILTEGFEKIEAITPINLLRRTEAEVTVASLDAGIHVTGRSGITLHADTPLAPWRQKPSTACFFPVTPA